MSTICDNILLKTIKIMSKKHEIQRLSKPVKKLVLWYNSIMLGKLRAIQSRFDIYIRRCGNEQIRTAVELCHAA